MLQLVTHSHNEKYNSNDNGVVPCHTSITPYPGPIITISHCFCTKLHEWPWQRVVRGVGPRSPRDLATDRRN